MENYREMLEKKEREKTLQRVRERQRVTALISEKAPHVRGVQHDALLLYLCGEDLLSHQWDAIDELMPADAVVEALVDEELDRVVRSLQELGQAIVEAERIVQSRSSPS